MQLQIKNGVVELSGEKILKEINFEINDTSRIADRFDRAGEMLLECGFKYYTVFEKRMPEFRRI